MRQASRSTRKAGVREALACAVAAVFVAAGCGGTPDGRATLPVEVAGWQRSGEVERFGPDELFDHIDGGAEIYLEKGFRELSVGQYVLRGEVEAMAELYRMETPKAASEMFTLEQGEGQTDLVGDEISLGTQSLAFRRGAYYAKLVAYGSGEALKEPLLELAKAIDRSLTAL